MSINQRIEVDENPMSGPRDTLPESPLSGPETDPKDSPAKTADPTRFGDWERAGRCIDF